MTTNAGSDISSSSGALGFTTSARADGEAKTMKALSAFLRPEFINRVDEIITFNPLTIESFVEIAKIMLGELVSTMGAKGVKIAFSDEAAAYVAKKSFDVKFGARNMRRFIQKNVEDNIAEQIISRFEEGITMVGIGYDEKTDTLDIRCA